ncbi:hypothetical protein D3C72_1332350 [compost metagenome]
MTASNGPRANCHDHNQAAAVASITNSSAAINTHERLALPSSRPSDSSTPMPTRMCATYRLSVIRPAAVNGSSQSPGCSRTSHRHAAISAHAAPAPVSRYAGPGGIGCVASHSCHAVPWPHCCNAWPAPINNRPSSSRARCTRGCDSGSCASSMPSRKKHSHGNTGWKPLNSRLRIAPGHCHRPS